MNLPKMYLAGPITGCTYGETTDWRKYLTYHLANEVDCLSPMRAKDYLDNDAVILKCYDGGNAFKNIMSSSRGIMSRDYWDCHRCDLLFVNLEGTKQVSIGTVMEIAWGFERRIPIVALLDKAHDHAMIREAVTHRCSDLEQAVQVVRALI